MEEFPGQFIVVTGLSGSGKSHTMRAFEDLGFYCVDNLPAALVPTFADLLQNSVEPRPRVAICVDARGGEDLALLPDALGGVRALGLRPQVLFLEARDDVLQRRYTETRRRHPASPAGGVLEGIHRERALLSAIRDRSDLVLDTSALDPAELRERICSIFLAQAQAPQLIVTVMTFGYKYGLPLEADLVLDLRFLPNPHYDNELRPLTGEDADVRDYVLSQPAAKEFMLRLQNLLKFLLPQYANEPKAYLTLALGCTGGRHRSVAIAGEVHRLIRDLQYDVRLRHRDIHRAGAPGLISTGGGAP